MATKKMAATMALRKGEIAVLRVCNADGTSYGGFQWPTKLGAIVKAPDWSSEATCGHGLHGWAKGEGDLCVADHTASGRLWYVLVVKETDIVNLNGKIKFPRCRILFTGEREAAATLVKSLHPEAASHYATVTGGDGATVTGGYGATVTGGDGATVTGGDRATVTGGDGATVTGGDGATVTGGDGATVTGGYGAKVTGGDGATVTGGDGAKVTGGDGATVTGGYGAKVTGGDGATLICSWHDGTRRRIAVAYVGEGDIKAGIAYKLDATGHFARA